MPDQCPNPACKIQLIKMIDNCLPRSSVRWAIGVFAGILAIVMFGIYGISAEGVGERKADIKENREQIADVKGELREIKTTQHYIQQSLKYLVEQNAKILEQVRELNGKNENP